MKQYSSDEVEPLMRILERNKKRLMAFNGVHRVDVGYKYKNGVRTDDLAIRVYVYRKKNRDELKPSEELPLDVDGVPIDVIESNPRLETEAP